MIVRQQSLPQFKSYKKYKPYLREDFRRRCAYCEVNEHRCGGVTHFGVDHFRPKSLFPKLVCVYSNLYYACNLCNSLKGNAWPDAALRQLGFYFADPCEEEVYQIHLKEREDGTLDCLTPCGEYTYDHLDLGRGDLIDWRRERRLARNDLPMVDRMIAEIRRTIPILPLIDRKRLTRECGALLRWRARLERDAE